MKIKALKESPEGVPLIFDDVHVATGLLKIYLRELPKVHFLFSFLLKRDFLSEASIFPLLLL
jgi:hypothetical protein